jgi:hypothetical protein
MSHFQAINIWNIYYQAWGKEDVEIRKQRILEHAKKQTCTVVLNHYDDHQIITVNNNINNMNNMKIDPFFKSLQGLSNQLLEKYQIPLYETTLRCYFKRQHAIKLRRVIPKPSHRTRFHCLRCPQERRRRQESLHRVDAILAYF